MSDVDSLYNMLPTDRQPVLKNDGIWICCPNPEHKGGNESTPSMRINVSNKFGNFFCFGCGYKGNIQELGKALKIKINNMQDVLAVSNVSRVLEESLLGEEEEVNKNIYELPWPNKDWRGINHKLLGKLQAKQYINDFGQEKLILPVKVNGKINGKIECALTEKAKLKYKYSSGQWIRRSLFPYDYVKNMPNFKKYGILLLGEGPRDSLNPLQYKFPALSIMGGITVWTEVKAELILDLNPRMVILAFDPDEIGQKVFEAAYEALYKYVPLKRLKFKVTTDKAGNKIKHDPGNMSKEKVVALKKKLFV